IAQTKPISHKKRTWPLRSGPAFLRAWSFTASRWRELLFGCLLFARFLRGGGTLTGGLLRRRFCLGLLRCRLRTGRLFAGRPAESRIPSGCVLLVGADTNDGHGK